MEHATILKGVRVCNVHVLCIRMQARVGAIMCWRCTMNEYIYNVVFLGPQDSFDATEFRPERYSTSRQNDAGDQM